MRWWCRGAKSLSRRPGLEPGPILRGRGCLQRYLTPHSRREDTAYGSRLKAGTTCGECSATLTSRHLETSPPLEIRHAALGRCLDAFLEVLGDAQLVLFDQLVVGRGQNAVGEAGAHGGAGGDQAERRTLGDLCCELHRL